MQACTESRFATIYERRCFYLHLLPLRLFLLFEGLLRLLGCFKRQQYLGRFQAWKREWSGLPVNHQVIQILVPAMIHDSPFT